MSPETGFGGEEELRLAPEKTSHCKTDGGGVGFLYPGSGAGSSIFLEAGGGLSMRGGGSIFCRLKFFRK